LPIANMAVEREGFVLRGKTLPLSAHRPGALPRGIVSFSPSPRGEYVFEARWHGAGHADVRSVIRVAAASRSGGMSSIGLHHRVELSGDGWHVQRAPVDGQATVQTHGALSNFEPDVKGRWVLADRTGSELVLG